MLEHDTAMGKADKYEKQYGETRNCCGDPSPEIVAFFELYGRKQARVLDLGCGQGRDALMAARHGHAVLGVDTFQTGIRQMLQDADNQGLNINGVVADLTDYQIDGNLDIVVLDRLLHMLGQQRRIFVLRQAIQHVSPEGFVLIADMATSKPTLRDVFGDDAAKWTPVLDRKGFLFMRRGPQTGQQSPRSGNRKRSTFSRQTPNRGNRHSPEQPPSFIWLLLFS